MNIIECWWSNSQIGRDLALPISWWLTVIEQMKHLVCVRWSVLWQLTSLTYNEDSYSNALNRMNSCVFLARQFGNETEMIPLPSILIVHDQSVASIKCFAKFTQTFFYPSNMWCIFVAAVYFLFCAFKFDKGREQRKSKLQIPMELHCARTVTILI